MDPLVTPFLPFFTLFYSTVSISWLRNELVAYLGAKGERMWLCMQMPGCHHPLRMQRFWMCLVEEKLSKWAEAGGESVVL